MINVKLVTRSAGAETMLVSMSAEAAVPRKGETVVLDRGRRFHVDEVTWKFASALSGTHTSVELAVQEICRVCTRPVWPDDAAFYPTCGRCQEAGVLTGQEVTGA